MGYIDAEQIFSVHVWAGSDLRGHFKWDKETTHVFLILDNVRLKNECESNNTGLAVKKTQ